MDGIEELQALQEVLSYLEKLSPNMKVSQAKVLVATAMNPGSKQAVIADKSGLTMSGMTRAYDVMSSYGRRDKTRDGSDASNVKMGLLCREPHPEDRRSWVMNLTLNGEKAIGRLVEILGALKN